MLAGERIKEARTLVEDLSARELSLLSGLSAGYVGLLESGVRTDPGSDVAIRIADTLGVSLDWLLAGSGAAPTAETIREAVTRARARQQPGGAAA